ncbi:unnamed protein product [Alternaria alternata]
MVSPFQSDYSYVCGMTTNTQRQQEAVEVEDNLPIPVVLENLGGVSGLVVAQAEDESDNDERDKGEAENGKSKSYHRKALIGMQTCEATTTNDRRPRLASASNELTRKAI